MKKVYTLMLSALAIFSASATDFNKIKVNKSVAPAAATSRATQAVAASRAVNCFYSGSTYENLADYYVVVSDTETAVYDQNMGTVTASDGWVLVFDFANDFSNPVALEPGKYKLCADPYPEDPAAFSVIDDYSFCQYYDAEGNVTISAVLFDDVTVSCDDEGVYTITSKAIDASGDVYDVKYTGRLPFTDPSNSYYVLRQIMEDRENEVFTGGMAFYYGTSLQTSKGGEMMVQLYSDVFGDNGAQYNESTMICLDIIGRPYLNGDPQVDTGVFPIKSYREAVRGEAIAGREITYMSQTIGIGCYLRDRSSSKYSSGDPYAYAYLESGDIEIEQTDKGYKISLKNGVTTLGYKVSFEYEGPIGPVVDAVETTEGSAKSTIMDDVDLELDDLPVARAYNGGVVNGNQTFLLDIGSRSGMDEQRIYGGDVMRFQFVSKPGTPVIESGEYNVMEEKYDTYYMPGTLAQTQWVTLPGGGTDISGTCYIHFAKDRYLVMDAYGWFLEGKVSVSQPNGEGEYDNRTYALDIDLMADNNLYVKGKWTGTVKLMYDPAALSAIGAVEADGSQAKVYMVTPGIYQVSDYAGEVKVYNVAGALCGTYDASSAIDLSEKASGLYIFKMGGASVKVIK